MKKYLHATASFLGLLCVFTVSSQQWVEDIAGNSHPAKKYTLMERFEPELTLTASERERLKAERFAEIKLKMQVLDTINTSERKREKLLSDLIQSPLSTRLPETRADTHAVDKKP